MLCWYYEKDDLKNTPSLRDGLNYDTEQRYRKEGVRLIYQCGTEMSLGHNTIATGAVYFHRFYMFHSFKEFPRYVTACCCLFLAGKVEETPKKCRDIIATARTILPDPTFKAFSEDLRKAKEEVMTHESILLQTMKFDLQVEHPYGFLVKYAKCLIGEKARIEKVLQMSWNFLNDSLSTTLCLEWEPEIIAVATIHLASKLSKFKVADWLGREPAHKHWWDSYIVISHDLLESICHQILDLYQQPGTKRGSESPPDQLGKKVAATPAQKHPISTSVLATSKTSSPNVAAPAVPPQAQMPVATKTTLIKSPYKNYREIYSRSAMENMDMDMENKQQQSQQQSQQQPPSGMNHPIPKIGPPLPLASVASTAIDTNHSAYNHYPPPPVYHSGPPPNNPKREEMAAAAAAVAVAHGYGLMYPHNSSYHGPPPPLPPPPIPPPHMYHPPYPYHPQSQMHPPPMHPHPNYYHQHHPHTARVPNFYPGPS